jgi:membrane protein DedA with SNARE-associated domain
MLGAAKHILSSLGPGAWALIFVLVALDSSAFLGLVLPGETVVLVSGALAGTGVLSIRATLAAVIGGAIAGDLCGYALGRYRGRGLLARWSFARRQYERHRERIDSYFARFGSATVLIGRFVAVGRAFTPFTAGLSGMPARRFVPVAAISGVLWGGALSALGYVLGRNWRLAGKWLKALGAGVLIVAAVAIFMAILWRWLAHHEDVIAGWWKRHVLKPVERRYGQRLDAYVDFVRARFSPTGYLGVHLTAGLVALGAFAWLFGGVVQDIFAQDPLVQVDQLVATLIADGRTPALDHVIAFVTFLADPRWLFGLTMAAMIVALMIREKVLAILMGLVPCAAYGLSVSLTLLFARISPGVPVREVVHGFSGFPDVSVTVATSCYGVIWYGLIERTRSWQWQTLDTIALLYVLILVGFGALCRGAMLSAVLGGFALSGCWLALSISGSFVWRHVAGLELAYAHHE